MNSLPDSVLRNFAVSGCDASHISKRIFGYGEVRSPASCGVHPSDYSRTRLGWAAASTQPTNHRCDARSSLKLRLAGYPGGFAPIQAKLEQAMSYALAPGPASRLRRMGPSYSAIAWSASQLMLGKPRFFVRGTQ